MSLRSKRRSGLAGPKGREVKIWFQGCTGSGKTMLARVIKEALEARGVKVREYVFGGEDDVGMDRQFVDLTHQSIDDVLTVELGGWAELEKLQGAR